MKKIIVTISLLLCIGIETKSQTINCNSAWQSIEDYQTGKYSNLAGVRRECLTDSLKNKLISILRNEFSEEEMDIRVLKARPDDWVKRIDRKTWGFLNNNNLDSSLYNYVKDSLVQREREQEIEKSLALHVDNSVINTIGNLYITEAIPDLRKALEQPEKYDQAAVEWALAMVGDSVYYHKFLDSLSQPIEVEKIDNYELKEQISRRLRLLSLRTQESIYQLSKFLSIDVGFRTINGSLDIYYHTGYEIYRRLFGNILNEDFLKIYPYDVLGYNIPMPYLSNDSEVPRESIKEVQKWLEDNRGKYIIYGRE